MNRSYQRCIIAFTALMIASGAFAKPDVETGKFDLVCRLHARFVKKMHPTYEGSWAMPKDSWRGIQRFAINLNSGRIRDVDTVERCAKSVCNSLDNTDDTDIQRVDKTHIIISAHPFRKWSIRHKDGWFESHYVVSPYTTQLTTGVCRRAIFTGFPAVPRLKRTQ